MSKTFYVNLFHNGFLKYSGFKKALKPAEDSTAKRPEIVPINSLRKAVKFPYSLDEQKNIVRISAGDVEVAFLVPTKDVPNLSTPQYEQSLYHRLVGSPSEEAEELRSKLEDKEKKIGKLKKDIRELEEEEEETGKGGNSSSRSELTCPECGVSSSKTSWNNNMGTCPSCNRVDMSDPEVR